RGGGRRFRRRASRRARISQAQARPRKSRSARPAPQRGGAMSETFLSRWSRRKRAADTSPRLRGEVDAPERSEGASGEGGSRPAEPVESPPHPDPLPASGEREFDPATLPPIESIDAGTDVSAFLRPGVPAELTQAALRRAWSADPAIRDFVGLAENAWDFNA